MSHLRVGVLASGRGTNLQAILDASEAGEVDATVEVVVSDVADATALERARTHDVPAEFVDPEGLDREAHDRRVLEVLDVRDLDLVCLAGYMRILSAPFVARYRGRLVNIHPSLLPAFQGLHAQRQALEYGVRITGCTTHLVDEEVDHGPILLQAAVPVHPDDTEETLARRILAQEHVLYPRTIQLFAQDRVRVEGRRVTIEDANVPDDGPLRGPGL